MTEPNSEPETREFYDARPSFETRPEDDPPMTVRVESWERRYDPTVRRVIRIVSDPEWPNAPWVQVSGSVSVSDRMPHNRVRDWPVSHPLDYSVAFRHTLTRQSLERAARSQLEGDMDVEAFRG